MTLIGTWGACAKFPACSARAKPSGELETNIRDAYRLLNPLTGLQTLEGEKKT